METSLHRQLKMRYAATEAQTEVVVNDFRIDAIAECGELIEIQHASLGALRDKTNKLLASRKTKLRIVKPIIARKRLVTVKKPGGEVVRNRMSPKRGHLLDIFLDLVHFATVFPKKRLTLEIILIESEEVRVDRKNPSRRGKRYRVVDQKLTTVEQSIELKSLVDLLIELPIEHLPSPFDTAELAAAIQKPRWFAQKVAYCLRQMGAAKQAGKRGNSQLYLVSPATIKRVVKARQLRDALSPATKVA